MQNKVYSINPTATLIKGILILLTSIYSLSCKKPKPDVIIPKGFNVVNLVANNNQYQAMRTDTNLINAWGIIFSAQGAPWISSEGSGVSLVYDSSGNQVTPPITIPSGSGSGHPCGIVFNANATDFIMPGGSSAQYIFAGNDGVISGWASGSTAEVILDRSATSSYTGATIAIDSGATFLYAANFKLAKIDVFDTSFTEVTMPFIDTTLPPGYAPFNIQDMGGQLYVMYAQIGPDSLEERGAGLGYIDIYNPDGSFVQRFISGSPLNAPWGLVQAPLGFVNFNNENAILIGNFGDGTINIFLSGGDFIGTLSSNGKIISVDGLHGLAFPPAGLSNSNRLYFTAGPNDKKDGLFGYIDKIQN